MTSFGHIDTIISTDRFNKIVFDFSAERSIYLVGGFIRDAFLGRRGLDRDYVLKRPSGELLEKIARTAGGRLVRIGTKGLWRIVLKGGGTLDFSPLKGNIEDDLRERDFTMNAIAWNPDSGMIDICSGREDIEGRTVRMIAEENIRVDPVRILRAYRLSHELAFVIDRTTRCALEMSHALAGNATPERITLEVFRLLSAPNPYPALKMMLEDGVMTTLISCHSGLLQKNLHVISRIEGTLDILPLQYLGRMREQFSQGLTGAGMLRLEAILSESTSNRFVLGRKVRKRIEGYKAASYLVAAAGELSNGVLFDLFLAAGDSSLDFLIIRGLTAYIPCLERWAKIMKDGTVTAAEIMEATGITEGELLGRMIAMVKREEFTGGVLSKAGALALAKEIASLT